MSYILAAPTSLSPPPAPRTAFAVTTNSPSDNLAGTESLVPVPGPVTSPPLAALNMSGSIGTSSEIIRGLSFLIIPY